MGKRSAGQFYRRPQDTYDTPAEAVAPLLPFLTHGTRFIEPCAGAGHLVDHLELAGHTCLAAFDIEPRRVGIARGDALRVTDAYSADCFITNPPWSRETLHPLIRCLSRLAPLWALFDADWMHTLQAAPFMPRPCRAIVSVGRVRWMPGTKMTGKDNVAWYYFDDRAEPAGPTRFFGRQAKGAST